LITIGALFGAVGLRCWFSATYSGSRGPVAPADIFGTTFLDRRTRFGI
jgi:hypothetical protein